MNASHLFDVLSNKKIVGRNLDEIEIVKITNDTRQVEDNTCFIAIKGEHFDGHQAIEAVIKKGARVLLVESFDSDWQKYTQDVAFVIVDSTYRTQAMIANQFYGQPSERLNLVAITGTNGKTTTSQMINDWLEKLNHKTGVLGTLHYKVNQTYYDAVNTTPNAIELQRLFNEMVEVGCSDAIIEASSHALELGRLSFTEVDCAIFTNLTREHLDFHHTMEQYKYAKSLLFAHLGQKFKNQRAKIAIVNIDDPSYETMVSSTSAEIITYSKINTRASVFAKDIVQEVTHTRFTLVNEDRETSVILNMLGDYNVMNFLAAFACLKYYYGYTTEQIIQVSQSFKGVDGRMQVIDCGQEFQVVVDFAHTPDAIENVMAQLSSNKKGRLLTLIGHSGGNRDSGARPDIGHIVFKYADEIIFTADNPRDEDVYKICNEIIGSHNEKPYQIIEDRKQAIKAMLEMANANDTLLFAGKGGEPYQIIGEIKHPFNEAEIIKSYLNKV